MIDKTIAITAHRGNCDQAPENTISALSAAIVAGVDFTEIDVQQTLDGELIVFHDFNLRRLTKTCDANIWELSSNQLQSLDVGRWFSPKFVGEKIPFLYQCFDLVKGKIKLNLELKLNGYEVNLAEAVVNLISQKDFWKDCIISSFDYDTLLKVKTLAPSLTVGLIINSTISNLEEFQQKFQVDFYSVSASYLTGDLIEFAHKNHQEVHVWTVNSLEEIKRFINLGVDNIITDKPLLALTLLNFH